MNLGTLAFAGFCAFTLAVSHRVPARYRSALLLAASYAFCATWSTRFVAVLVGVTACNYLLGRVVRDPIRGRLWLWLGIVANLGVLFGFRLFNFFLPDLLAAFARLGVPSPPSDLQRLIPVGLSFYTLQAIAYLVDVHRGVAPASTRPLDFALYLAWFPKLTAGPIERPGPFLSQLAAPREFTAKAVESAFALVLLGLTRKVVFADPLLAAVPPTLHHSPAALGIPALIGWTLIFGIGLYCDFAGYTDIARGTSRLFGIELGPNFRQPVFSRSLVDFWGRWHISLSSWLRDYVFFPVDRALVRRNPGRKQPATLIVPPVLTMLASGLWHGLALNFALWGFFMGAFQAAERIATLGRPAARRLPEGRSPLAGILAIFLLLVASPWFLAPAAQAWAAWSSLADPAAWAGPWTPRGRLLWLILPAMWIDYVQWKSENEVIFLAWSRPARVSLTTLAVLAVFLSARAHVSEPFVYHGF